MSQTQSPGQEGFVEPRFVPALGQQVEGKAAAHPAGKGVSAFRLYYFEALFPPPLLPAPQTHMGQSSPTQDLEGTL